MSSRFTRWVLADAGLSDFAPLRYLLGSSAKASWRSAVLHVLMAVAFIALPIVAGNGLLLVDGSLSDKVSAALYLPTVGGQAIVSAAAFAFTLHVVHSQRRKQTWDTLRATAGGTMAAMHAAWAAAVYYRLSGLLGVVVFAPRIVLLALLLWDFTAFRGDYLFQIAGGHRPAIPPLLELPLMGAFVAAAFLLPISAVGLEAAVGLLFSTFARSRQTASLIQITLTVCRVLWSVLAVRLLGDLLRIAGDGESANALDGWLTMLLGGAAGDWGFGMLHAAAVDRLWAAVPYAAYVGVALLGVVMFHSALTAIILRWAARRAQRID